MQLLSLFLDKFLYFIVLVTLGLAAFKFVALYFPRLMGRPAMDRQLGATEDELDAQLEQLESGLIWLSVIGVAAPFVGLMGTVMHIIEALRQLNGGAIDMSLVSGPIATALNTTLVGLFSAVPAVVGGAIFQRRVEVLHSRHRRLLRAAHPASVPGAQS